MKKIARVFTALGLLSGSVALADEANTTTKVHETDGKKTTNTRKVKHKADGKGNEEVTTESTKKTEVSPPSGKGGDKMEVTKTHETDGKKTTHTTRVTHKAGSKGSEVKSESTQKTELSKP